MKKAKKKEKMDKTHRGFSCIISSVISYLERYGIGQSGPLAWGRIDSR